MFDSGLRAASRGYLWWIEGGGGGGGQMDMVNITVVKTQTMGNKACVDEESYLGGQRLSSRNSSILLVSVFTSVPYSRKGG